MLTPAFAARLPQPHDYLYQAEGVARFTLLPWDLDDTFALNWPFEVPASFTIPEDCSLRYPSLRARISRASGR